MRSQTLAIVGFTALGLAMAVPASTPAHALPALEPLDLSAVSTTLVEKAQYGYCRRWYRECRFRWGWGWRFRRCMRRHGC